MRKKFRLFGASAAATGVMVGAAVLTLPQATATAQSDIGFAHTTQSNRPGSTLSGTGTPAAISPYGVGTAATGGRPGAGGTPDGGTGTGQSAGVTVELASRAGAGRSVGQGAGRGAVDGPGGWRPVRHGLTDEPGRILPAGISRGRPVRVVTTTVDAEGRPVVTARTASDRATAAGLVREGQRARNAIGVEIDAPVRAADAPTGDDQFRSLQWDLARINAPSAWARSTGAGITVAVIDTGVDANHPDLAGQVLPGGDLVDGTEGTATDPNGHGTHVAGTIAALTGNGLGVSGIAPDAKILPVRVLGPDGSGYLSTAASGVIYAADHGADVINLSLSATVQTDAMTNAVAYARSRNVVVVAAAGNARSQGSPVSYPAADPGVIAVAATDSADNPATYSNRGGYVDVAAPGTSIASTFPGASYRRMSGTSMAAPHVAAVAALVKAYDKSLSPDRIEQVIESSSVDLGTPGRDDDFGTGLVDAAAAVASARPVREPEPQQTPAPAPETPQADNRLPADVKIVRTGARQLTIAIRGAEGQAVELQQQTGDGWQSVLTYQAVLVTRLNDLTAGVTYRVVVADSAHYLGVSSNAVRM